MKGKRTTFSIAAALVLAVAVGAWAMWGESVDPAVAELEAQRELMFSGEATDAQRGAFRQQVQALTDEQRRQLFQRGRPDMQRRLAERMGELFKGSPEQVRQEAKRRADAILDARRQRANNADSGGRGGPGGGRFANMTDAQRDQRRKQRLDFVDAETRGQMSEMRRLIDQELESRGEPPLGPGDMRAMMGLPRR